jgi:hypothetical protein
MENGDTKKEKKEYNFGGIKEFDLEKIEAEVLQESVYLDVFAGSDLAFKDNVVQINQADALCRLAQLNGYTFQYKTLDFPENNFPVGEQIGFMAQEVELQFPDLIKKDSTGHSYVNYTQIIPVMAEAIKELSAKVESLEKKLLAKN